MELQRLPAARGRSTMIDNSYADFGGSYGFGAFDDAGPSSFGAGSSPEPVADSFSASDSSSFAAPFDSSFVGPPAPPGLPAYSADEMAGDFAREQNRFTALPSFRETSAPASTLTTITPYTGGTGWAADVAARRTALDWWTNPSASAPAAVDMTPRSIEVQPGDSLSRIAGRLAGDGASAGAVNDIKNGFIAANPQLSNPNLLQVGQWLHVPRADTVFDSAAFSRAATADAQYLAARQPVPAFSASTGLSAGFGSGLGFGGPSFANLSLPSSGFGSWAPPSTAAAPADALAQSRADMKAFYAQAQDNALRDGNPFKYVGAHIASLAGDVGYEAMEGARGLFRLATDGQVREAAWNGVSNAVSHAVAHPGETWDAGVRGVNHFLELPFQEQADAVFKGGLGLLAGGGTARLTSGLGGLASGYASSARGLLGGAWRELPEAVDALPRYAKAALTEADAIGRFDPDFAPLGLQGKVTAAFQRIEDTFGQGYADAIRDRFDRVSLQSLKGSEDLGEFLATKKGGTISLNTNIGNADLFANTLLHEVRHARQFEKLGLSVSDWNKLPDAFVEKFATSTNIWQGRRLGLSDGDLDMFVRYYDEWRK
jgi:hypothetical protein